MDLLRGFIFDIDGTLLDSNDAHARSLKLAFGEAGYQFEFSEIRPLIGMGLDRIIPKLTALPAQSETGRKISHLKDRYFDDEFDRLNAFHGAKDLVSALFVRGYQITVASSASGSDLRRFVDKLDIGPYLVATASAENTASKPAPDIIERALFQLGMPPDEVLMVGDTPYDIEAASRAGVRTIALRCGGWSDSDLRAATAIFDHPGELLDKLRSEWRPSEVFNPS